MKLCQLSPQLSDFLGIPQLPRTEVPNTFIPPPFFLVFPPNTFIKLWAAIPLYCLSSSVFGVSACRTLQTSQGLDVLALACLNDAALKALHGPQHDQPPEHRGVGRACF